MSATNTTTTTINNDDVTPSTTTLPPGYSILPLDEIIQKDNNTTTATTTTTTTTQFVSNLINDGFCLVQLSKDLQQKIKTPQQHMLRYFKERFTTISTTSSTSTSTATSDTSTSPAPTPPPPQSSYPLVGYSTTTTKMAFRLLTGDHSKSMDSFLPSYGRESLMSVVSMVDQIQLSVLERICESLFNCDLPTLGERYSIPLLKSNSVKFGLFDVTYYPNDAQVISQRISTQPANCSPHMDPGLLLFNVLSSSPGLEFQHPSSSSWISYTPPEGVGVFWCGATAAEASHGRVKAAVHRVVYGDTPRMTMWHEVCVESQVSEVFLSLDWKRRDCWEKAVPPDLKATITIHVKTLTGRSFPTQVRETNTILDLKCKIEDKEGISPMKMRLVWRGRALADNKTIGEMGMKNNDIVHLVLAL